MIKLIKINRRVFSYEKSLGYMIVALFCAYILPIDLYSQGKYLERGMGGFGVSTGFSSNDDATAFKFSGGYSIDGIFDIGLTVGRVSFDDFGTITDLKATGIVPQVSMHLLKRTPEMPISIVIGGGYEKDLFSSDALDEFDLDMTGWAVSGGGAVFATINASPTMILMPTVGFSYTHAEVKIEDNVGNSIVDDDNSTSFSFGLSFVFNLQSNNVIYLDPNVSVGDNNTTIGFSIGFVSPGNRKDGIKIWRIFEWIFR